MSARSSRPASANDWAAATFEPIQFAPPNRAEMHARADNIGSILVIMAAILGKNDRQLEAHARICPGSMARFVDHLGVLADELRHDADLCETAQARLVAVLMRIDLAGAR